MTVQLPPGSCQQVCLRLKVHNCRLRQCVDVCCTVDCVQGYLYTGSLSRRYAGERFLPECVIKQHGGLTPGITLLGAISNHGRSHLLRFEGNLNSIRYAHEVLHNPQSFPSFNASIDLSLSRIMYAHMLQRLLETSV
ncbi:hypothetical protein TNCV_286441 [Trichonephila clavipes]|nr:hypothetical protein TNCV_286441 [Trichonephila clavipes]